MALPPEKLAHLASTFVEGLRRCAAELTDESDRTKLVELVVDELAPKKRPRVRRQKRKPRAHSRPKRGLCTCTADRKQRI